MKILAFDSSGAYLSIALLEGERLLEQTMSDGTTRHSNALVLMIDALLKKNFLKIGEIDILVVGLGPGSFTGSRVAVATAKVLGYVLKKKIVGVSNLEAAAIKATQQGHRRVAVMMDARKNKVYGAIYQAEKKGLIEIMKPSLLAAPAFLKKAKKATQICVDEQSPSAFYLARAAWPRILKKKFMDPFDLEPLYLHARDCNVTYAKK